MKDKQTPLRVVPTVGSSTSAPPGYPTAPHDDRPIDHSPGQGQPADAATISQGFDLLEACVNCGRAFKPFDMLSHNQLEGIYNGPRFGREAEI